MFARSLWRRYYEYKHAFSLKKRIILIRMIPFDQEFEELQARVIFGANRLVIPWMVGAPMPPDLPDTIMRAMGLVAPAAPAPAPLPQPALGLPPAAAAPTPVAASSSAASAADDSLTSFLGSWYPALQADLDELGAEEAEDLKGLEPQDIELLASKLKKLQQPKFRKKMAAFLGGGAAADTAAAAAQAPSAAAAQAAEAKAAQAEREKQQLAAQLQAMQQQQQQQMQ